MNLIKLKKVYRKVKNNIKNSYLNVKVYMSALNKYNISNI